ncbi:MAG: hypothetical protein H7A25_06820 [Leptospiraceae bacterium]|nr:hypothetical protein [Leptospiraceae bacterium]MCP5499599.1 hypothetical protein [Leptospiraceae bacterium]
MIIRAIESPVYRRRRGGLKGRGLNPEGVMDSPFLGLTFEDYLKDLFEGQLVQTGNLFSTDLSEMMRRNLQLPELS